jgi:hypothetical protein
VQNALQELFDKLTEYERQLIKGILPPHYTVGELLSLNGSDFLLKLQDSLPIKELGKLSAAEVKFRGDLMDKVVDAWSSSTNNNINTKDDNSNTEIRKRTPNENRDHFYHEVMARTTFKHIVIL